MCSVAHTHKATRTHNTSFLKEKNKKKILTKQQKYLKKKYFIPINTSVKYGRCDDKHDDDDDDDDDDEDTGRQRANKKVLLLLQ